MGRTPAVDQLLAGRPDLLSGWQALESGVWEASGVPPAVLSLCRLRVHQLMGCPPPDPVRWRPPRPPTFPTGRPIRYLTTWTGRA